MGQRRTAIALGTLLLGAGGVATWVWQSRRNPSACPFGQRVFLDLPRPFLRRDDLLRILAPAPGERLLEVGPGTGYYTLDIAGHLEPGGQLDILDLQPAMLEETMRRAAAGGVRNVVPTPGNAQELPYPDATFDAAYLVATLGEVPGKDRALRELRRVLKQGGRLVVGEGQPDPHMVSLHDLREQAREVGLRYERHHGGRFGYLARFGVSEETP
ncbi:MAG: class I SAM-dependent methyltransferase [Chloroflexi bacterium]|nr:class I SAM-dependent methyltransferase [Chloroflexota bacterium]